MIKAWDADGHVSESEVTFSDKYWDAGLRSRRPEVIEIGSGRALRWLIDTRAFPVRTGPYQQAGFPLSKDGRPAEVTPGINAADPVESAEPPHRGGPPRATGPGEYPDPGHLSDHVPFLSHHLRPGAFRGHDARLQQLDRGHDRPGAGPAEVGDHHRPHRSPGVGAGGRADPRDGLRGRHDAGHDRSPPGGR